MLTFVSSIHDLISSSPFLLALVSSEPHPTTQLPLTIACRIRLFYLWIAQVQNRIVRSWDCLLSDVDLVSSIVELDKFITTARCHTPYHRKSASLEVPSTLGIDQSLHALLNADTPTCFLVQQHFYRVETRFEHSTWSPLSIGGLRWWIHSLGHRSISVPVIH